MAYRHWCWQCWGRHLGCHKNRGSSAQTGGLIHGIVACTGTCSVQGDQGYPTGLTSTRYLVRARRGGALHPTRYCCESAMPRAYACRTTSSVWWGMDWANPDIVLRTMPGRNSTDVSLRMTGMNKGRRSATSTTSLASLPWESQLGTEPHHNSYSYALEQECYTYRFANEGRR